ncbi:ComF family protein [Luteithermobacter gelatinilyticus]|uniref:ComF family protein n=1 Tax=Luteithermobacter gelatinilyticus TaxID=2582913 RepID=UPI001AEF72F7|nr:ComF family protein [Luteithermobacter gelatinilyticus]
MNFLKNLLQTFPFSLAPVHMLPGTVGGRLLDLVLPPRCLACGGLVQEAARLCAVCWGRLDFLTDPCCACCGYPFDLRHDGRTQMILCGVCQSRPRRFDRARSALRYDAASRPLVLAFKHGDRTDYAPYFADLLWQAGGALLADCDLILPVPLHPRRLRKRRYNQAALLSAMLSRKSGVPHDPLLVRRRRHTPPQQGNLAARVRNVRGAFILKASAREAVAEKAVLLIDDVFTTGATLEACAAVLKKAGAQRVDGLTLCRVVQPTPAV